jgi:hypothetical protein
MTQGDDNGHAEGSFWAALAARAIHPIQVEIIEAMRWIDRPLTATDLSRVLEEQRAGLRIDRRLRQLARLDAVALDDNGKARGPIVRHAYRLTRQSRP